MVLLFAFAASEWIWPRRLPRAEARTALMIAVAAAAATLLNPYGWGLWRISTRTCRCRASSRSRSCCRRRLPAYRAFYVYLALAAVLLLLDRRAGSRCRTPSRSRVFATFGLMHLRETPLVLLRHRADRGAAPRRVDRSRPRLPRDSGHLALRGAGRCREFRRRVLLRAIRDRQPTRSSRRSSSRAAPSTSRSRAGLSGPVFNSLNLGGYIAWKLYPTARVFQDTRFQAYPPEHFRSTIAASRVAGRMESARRGCRLGNGLGAAPEPALRRRTVSRLGMAKRLSGRCD